MNGVLVLDKPAGVTSHTALDPIKRLAGRGVRVGHAGTLDPFATGVLLALVGDATRLAELAVGLSKTYEATVRFGVATDTLDPQGAITASSDPGSHPPEGIPEAFGRLVGEIEQVPPSFSALKVDGRRAHRLARAGQSFELTPRRVVIHSIEILLVAWPDVRIRVRCGAGTYVRSLARDVGAALSLPAHLASLRRTSIGPFCVEPGLVPGSGTTLEEFEEKLLPPLDLVRATGLEEVQLDSEAARNFLFGRKVSLPGAPPGPVAAVASRPERLLGLGVIEAEAVLRPRKVLSSAQAALL